MPRGPEGEPFKLLKADEVSDTTGGVHVSNQVHVAGAMTPSGEAWLSVAEASTEKGQPPVVGLFHRAPGEDQFRLDTEATRTLGPLLGSEAEDPGRQGVTLRIGESAGGHAYGILSAPSQYAALGELGYGLLQEGKWTVETVKAATEPPKPFGSADPVRLKLDDVQGPGEGWGAFEVEGHRPGWGLSSVTSEAANGRFRRPAWMRSTSQERSPTESKGKGEVTPEALKADGKGRLDRSEGRTSPLARKAAAWWRATKLKARAADITNSWCTLPGKLTAKNRSNRRVAGGGARRDLQTESGPVALAIEGRIRRRVRPRQWTSVLAPGYGPFPGQTGAEDVFAEPQRRLARRRRRRSGTGPANGASGSLTSWPLPDRSPLTSVALPPGSAGRSRRIGCAGGRVRWHDAQLRRLRRLAGAARPSARA